MNKADIEKLNETGHYYNFPCGISMLPMLKYCTSIVDIVPLNGKLKKYDAALYYNKKTHRYILHRVIKVLEDKYIFSGDNCLGCEIVPHEDVIGVLARFKRNLGSEWISVNDKRYLLYVHFWCDFLPVRRLLIKIQNILLKKSIKKAAKEMLYLIMCQINNVKPKISQLNEKNFELLYKISQQHLLTNIVFSAIENAYGKDLPKNELMSLWRTEKDKAAWKNILFDIERKELTDFCEKSGIWYMPLKGSVIKDLYPKNGMREMADIDILFDTSYRNVIKDWFTAKGYEYCMAEEKDFHDSCFKEPFYHFEMHTALFRKVNNSTLDKLADYYANVKDKLISDESKLYGYHFTDEDFYIFMLAHAYKHSRAGTGLRSLLDCYVYYKAYENKLNWDYIEKELDVMGIWEFEQKIKCLAQKIFAYPAPNNTLTAEEERMLEYVIFSGAYGTAENLRRYAIESSLKSIANDCKNISWRIKFNI